MSIISSRDFSIVIPHLNDTDKLIELLDSVKSQSIQPLEILIADDCSIESEKNRLLIIESDYDRVELIFNEKNLGPNANLNQLILLARGTYVFPRSSNDVMAPGYLSGVEGALNAFPDSEIVVSSVAYFSKAWEAGTVENLELGEKVNFFSAVQASELLTKDHVICGAGVAFRKDAFIEAGMYRSESHWYADWIVHLRMMFRHGFAYIPIVGGYFRIDSSSYSASSENRSLLQESAVSGVLNEVDQESAEVRYRILKSGVLQFILPQEKNFQVKSELPSWVYSIFKNPSPLLLGRKDPIRNLIVRKIRSCLPVIEALLAKEIPEIYIVGAGGFAEKVFEVWIEHELPEPNGFLQSGESQGLYKENIPILSFRNFDPPPRKIIYLIASKAYEKELFERIDSFPFREVICFYSKDLSSL